MINTWMYWMCSMYVLDAENRFTDIHYTTTETSCKTYIIQPSHAQPHITTFSGQYIKNPFYIQGQTSHDPLTTVCR